MNTLRLLGPPFFYTHLMAMMEKVKYSKPVLKIQLLIDKIKEKGFEMSDHEAENVVWPFVVNNGYYHISSYMKCFCKSENSIDTVEGKNINFRNVITLYRLSKDLEEVLFSMLLRIEVFLKSNFIHHTTQFYNDAFWHIKPQNIISIDSWEHRKECIRKIQKENKNAPIVKSFFDKYKGRYLTIWHLVEVASFWSFTRLFTYLPHEISVSFYELLWIEFEIKEDRRIYNQKQFKNRLRGLCEMRNRIAHSEMIRWKMALPRIKLPNIDRELNTTCSYIQLIYHLSLRIVEKDAADTFYAYCYYILCKIEDIDGIREVEKSRIGITNNRKDRFKTIRKEVLNEVIKFEETIGLAGFPENLFKKEMKDLEIKEFWDLWSN